jgi:hypothetical protein
MLLLLLAVMLLLRHHHHYRVSVLMTFVSVFVSAALGTLQASPPRVLQQQQHPKCC